MKNVSISHDSILSITSSLNIVQYKDPFVNLENINDPLEKIKEKYKIHSSILAILQKQFGNSYSFIIIPKKETEKESLRLNDAKASQQLDTSTKIIKMNVNIGVHFTDLSKAFDCLPHDLSTAKM